MAGTNYHWLVKRHQTPSPSKPRIFIAHRKSDRDAAIALADWLSRSNIDYFLDEESLPLQAATAANDEPEVLRIVEDALTCSSHLLGIISKSTQDSWWVPFEIGQARRLKLKMAHIILDNVSTLPEYMCVSEDLQDAHTLTSWLRAHVPYYIREGYPTIPNLHRKRTYKASFR